MFFFNLYSVLFSLPLTFLYDQYPSFFFIYLFTSKETGIKNIFIFFHAEQ